MGKAPKAQWSEAVREALARRNLAQPHAWLAEQVAADLGLDQPLTRQSATRWLAGNPPEPARVFAIERVLGLPPGSTSRLLGYVPAVPDREAALAAIAADGRLTEDERQRLSRDYLAAVLGKDEPGRPVD